MGKMTVMRGLLIVLALGAGRAAWGQEEMAIDNFSGVGVRAMGMGGAFGATWSPR